MQGITRDQRFTVVIPTRERCDTLEHTLRTCVMQDYDNLEILVSDNFSQDRTREVVESFKDRRIRYLNTGKRLSMTDNFEFALSHVTPEGYVIYIGDDDGLLPNAIRDIDAVIIKTEASVLRWDVPRYFWPTIEHHDANRLIIPSWSSGITRRNSATTIQDVLLFKAMYGSLPVMYLFSAVKYEVIRKIKNSSRRFFNSCTPDVYSGFAIAGTVKDYFNSKRPYTIAGSSHHSTGANQLEGASSKAAQKYLSEENLPFHSSLVRCRSLAAITIEGFFQAREHLPSLREFSLNMEDLLSEMMLEAAARPKDVYMEIKDTVLQIGELHNIPKAAQKAIAVNPNRAPGFRRKLTVRNLGRVGRFVRAFFLEDLYRGGIYLDCAPFSVKNILDASILCHHLLVLKDIDFLSSSAIMKSSSDYLRGLIYPRKTKMGEHTEL